MNLRTQSLPAIVSCSLFAQTPSFARSYGVCLLFARIPGSTIISFRTSAASRSYNPSTFDPLARSLTRTVESRSSWKSDCCSFNMGSNSKTSNNFLTTLDFTVYCSFFNCFSNDDLPSFFLLIRSACKTPDSPDLSFATTICLFARRCSFIVRISRSILPFPVWSRTGQVMCSIPNCSQNCKYYRLKIMTPDRFLFSS